jgi:hypothetical protein
MLSLILGCAIPPEPVVPEVGELPGSPTAPTPPQPEPDPTTTTPPETFIPSSLQASCEPTSHPLQFACRVNVDPPQPVQIRFGKSDGTGQERTQTSDAALSEHDIVLYFMSGDTDYHWTAETLQAGDTQVTGAFHSGQHPEMPKLVVSGQSSAPYVGSHDPCSNPSTQAQVFDTVTGELVWYQEVDPGALMGLRHMIRFTEDHTVLADIGIGLVEMDLLGNELVRLELGTDFEYMLHHDVNKSNGYIYALFEVPGSPALDGVYIFDPTGVMVGEWHASSVFEPPLSGGGSWLHTNTVWVDEAGDILLSSWAMSSVIKIEGDWTSPEFGQHIWTLSGEGFDDVGDDFVIDWSAVDDADRFQRQHDLKLLPDGRMLMLDNHVGRGLILSLDEATMTATAESAYSTGYICGPQGTAAATTGHVFVGCSGPDILEYDLEGELLWQATAVCPSGDEAISARWYPLEGW